MNTTRVLRIPRAGLVILTLILLAVGNFALLKFAVWSLIHVSSNQSLIQVDPSKVVEEFHTAINSQNSDAILGLLAKDMIINDSGSIIQGNDDIRNWILHSQRMTGLSLTMLHSEAHGNKITWNDLAHKGTNVENRAYILRWTAVIQNGKIQSLMVSLLPMPDGK